MASLLRQGWSDRVTDATAWPQAFHNSRRWCFLALRPGLHPVEALVSLFFDTWQYTTTSSERVKEEKGWIEPCAATKPHCPICSAQRSGGTGTGESVPPAFFLYIDQGEELYVRAEERERRRFSEILAYGLTDQRLRALMSMRSDFLGELQRDEPLFSVHRQINVPALREAELCEVVSPPADLLSARFEIEGFAATIARRTAEESAKDTGALPLLSYLLDDMWTKMVDRKDGILRPPKEAFELGGVLARRANAFVSGHSNSEDKLRRIFTLKLASVREDGEPSRRRASRRELSEEEWRLVTELADYPYRLLVTVTSEAGELRRVTPTVDASSGGALPSAEIYAEVAHEAIFRRWDKLRDWIVAEREFLIFKGDMERAEKRWREGRRADNALLKGLDLSRAQEWDSTRASDLSEDVQLFIDRSITTDRMERDRQLQFQRRVSVGATLAALLLAIVGGVTVWKWRQSVESEARLTISEQRLKQERDTSQRAQSRYLADLAFKRIQAGDGASGVLLALAALPDGNSIRPTVSQAERALLNGSLRLQEAIVFAGHQNGLNKAIFSPDGLRVLTASADGTVRLWEAKTGRSLQVFRAHDGSVMDVAFDAHGARVITASLDGTARIWDADSGRQLFVLSGHNDAVYTAAFSPDERFALTASADATARLWDAKTGKQLSVFRGHQDAVWSALFNPDGRRILTASQDDTARVWDPDLATKLLVLRRPEPSTSSKPSAQVGHLDSIFSAKFSRDGRRIVTASRDRTAIVWNAETGEQVLQDDG